VCAKWERKWRYKDNQEVGLEAAILERKRNSSLVKRLCTDNLTGLKRATEAAGHVVLRIDVAVGEHCLGSEGDLRGSVERRQESLLA
jgi:hypothetical protein